MLRAGRIALIAAGLLAGFAATEGAAQERQVLSVELTAGPSYRVLGPEVTYDRDGFRALTIELAGGISLGTRLRAIIAAGVLMTPDMNVYEPLLPGSTPPVSADESIGHWRAGLGYQSGRLRLGAGAVFATTSDGFEKERAVAPFLDLQVRPFRRSLLTVGAFAYQFPRTVGGYRAVVTPTIGLRF